MAASSWNKKRTASQRRRDEEEKPTRPMEASRFGFGPGTSSAFKFDPTDADIVAFYLLPRALGAQTPPHGHAIINADPLSGFPWDLMSCHGHGDSAHAFFIVTGAARNSRGGGRRDRVVKGVGGVGGTWRGQKGSTVRLTLLRPGGGEVGIEYKKYNLTFYLNDGEGSTGWVMHEYEITSPPLPGTVLSRIRPTDKGKETMATEHKKQRQQDEEENEALPFVSGAGAGHQQLALQLDQAGPSHQYLLDYNNAGAGDVYVNADNCFYTGGDGSNKNYGYHVGDGNNNYGDNNNYGYHEGSQLDGEGLGGGAQTDVFHGDNDDGGRNRYVGGGDSSGFYLGSGDGNDDFLLDEDVKLEPHA